MRSLKRINPFYQPAAESAREGGNRARGSAGGIGGGGHGVGSGVLRNGAGPQSIPSKAKDIFSFKEIDDSEQSRVQSTWFGPYSIVFKIVSSRDDDDMMVVKFVHYQISRRCWD